MIVGIRETHDLPGFCAERGITAEIELIAIRQINEAFERLLRRNVKYRFVIDMAPLRGMDSSGAAEGDGKGHPAS